MDVCLQTREPLWRDPWHNPQEDFNRRSPLNDRELSLSKDKYQPKKPQDYSALFHSLKACGEQKDLYTGSRLHAYILERGFLEHDISLGNALISMYAKCGALAIAQESFDELPARNVVTWNALIAGYAQHGLGDEALCCFDHMEEEGFSPNAVTFICALKACGSVGAAEKGEEIHAEVDRQGLLKKDTVLGTALVDMYAKCGKLAKAQGVFNKITLRNVVTWNALITGYTQHGLNYEALSNFERMQHEGVCPNIVTFICILKACGNMGTVIKGEEIHAEICRQGLLEKNEVLSSALVDMYVKCGTLAKAQEVFDKLSTQDVASWTALIAGYTHHGLGDEALNYFEHMRDKGLSPNAVTFICVLKACGSVGALKKGEQIHTEVSRQGLLMKDNILGTSLVDMYVKCGMLAKAEGVFAELPTQNVVAWNALINGYAEHKLGDEALRCFRQMQNKGVSPDAITFIGILKACCCIGAVERGEEIHAKIIRQGLLERDNVLGTALIDMYAKCGALAKAQGVFDRLPNRNLMMWNALIAGYAQLGLGHEALIYFSQMQEEGYFGDVITFIWILKACGSINDVEKGGEIHADIRRQGLLEKDLMLGNALMDMYAKCGSLAKAQEVFDELPTRDVALWTTLIAGYAQHGLSDKALSCFEQMQDEGFSPNAVTITCILKACGSIGAVRRGEEIHAEVGRQGLLEKDTVLGTSLVDMYAKCGALAKAQEVFDEISTRDVATWTALIAGYVQCGLSDEALSFFEQMKDEGLSPNAVTFLCIIKACGSIGAVEKGEEVHAEVLRQGLLEKDNVLCTALVDMYAKCGEIAKAQGVFEDISARNAVTWNVLIAGYAQHGYSDEAMSCLQQMQDEGLAPDVVTFICILNACGNIGAAKKGAEIHAKVGRQGLLEKDNVLGTALVDMYAKCGVLEKAQQVFDKLPARNVVTWNVLLAGYTQHGLGDEALTCFGRMRDEGLLPDAATFICILKACSSIGAVEKGKEIHAEVDREGLLENDVILGTALVDMYAKCGELAKAQKLLDELPAHGIAMWTALIAGYAQVGKVIRVFNSFIKMIGEGIEPNLVTFVVLLTACSHAGLVEEGQTYFDTMISIYHISPTVEHHTCMVDMFSRAGQFGKAVSVIKEVPPSNSDLLWLAFISACGKWVNVELGRWAFKHAVQLDKKLSGAYMCMSNIHAVAGMLEEASEVQD